MDGEFQVILADAGQRDAESHTAFLMMGVNNRTQSANGLGFGWGAGTGFAAGGFSEVHWISMVSGSLTVGLIFGSSIRSTPKS